MRSIFIHLRKLYIWGSDRGHPNPSFKPRDTLPDQPLEPTANLLQTLEVPIMHSNSFHWATGTSHPTCCPHHSCCYRNIKKENSKIHVSWPYSLQFQNIILPKTKNVHACCCTAGCGSSLIISYPSMFWALLTCAQKGFKSFGSRLPGTVSRQQVYMYVRLQWQIVDVQP